MYRLNNKERDISLSPGANLLPQGKLAYLRRNYAGTILVALGLSTILLTSSACCVCAIYVMVRSSDWTALYSFGASMSLQLARYLNFGLDMIIRGLAVAASLAINYVAIRIATSLSFKRTGVAARDAVILNLTSIKFSSLWDCARLQIPGPLKTWLSTSLVCGLTSYFASSLIFGYVASDISRADQQAVQLWGYTTVLGSNTSGFYIAPNYTDLMPESQLSPFVGPVARTMANLDTMLPNATYGASFSTLAESSKDLLLRNITSVLQSETITTRLVNCRPIAPSDNATFDFSYGQTVLMDVSISMMDGTSLIKLNQQTTTNTLLIFPVGNGSAPPVPLNQANTFVLQTEADSLSPTSQSKLVIALVDGNVCTNGEMQTPFGTITPFTSAAKGIPLTIAGIICDLQRTRSSVDTHTGQSTSEVYLTIPILGAAGNTFLYSPIGKRGFDGVGALLYQHVNGGTDWRIPNCGSFNPGAFWSVDNSDVWAQAVQLVELYESSLLQSALQLTRSSQELNVLVSKVSYRIAILPVALLAFGTFLGLLCCTLLYLLVFWSRSPRAGQGLDLLRVVHEIDRYNSISQRLPANRQDELDAGRLQETLGTKRLRRYVSSFEEE